MGKSLIAWVLAATIAGAAAPAFGQDDEGGAAAAGGAEAPAPARAPVVVVGTNAPGDAARVNAAIAGSQEGAEILLRGTFLIDEPIRLLGRRAYRGESRAGTILRQADNANLPALMASSVFLDNNPWTGVPISVRHLQLDGNRKNNPDASTAGLVVRSWLSVVEDVHIRDMPGDGLRLTNLSADGTGLNTTQVNGRITHCFIERSGRHGIFVEDTQNAVTDWILSDCWIASSGADGIRMDNAAGWFVERNHIYGVPGNAIYARRLFATSISDNYIEGFGDAAEPGTWHGIYASLQGGTGSTIACNRIFNFGGESNDGSTYRYLMLTVNYGTGVAAVTGNVIRGKGTERGTGLVYAAPGDKKLVLTSTGNAVLDVGTARTVEPNVDLQPGL